MLFDRDNWQEIIHTLRKNKIRSFLTAFGVFWGVFLLIVMLGSGKGLYNGVMQEFSGMAANSVFIWPQRTTLPYKGLPRGRRFHFGNGDIEALRRKIPEIEFLAPRNQLGGHRDDTNVTRGSKYGAFNIFGDYPEIAHIQLMDITEGRFLNHFDLEEKRKVAVIGTRVRNILFDPGENPIGRYIKIKGVYFKVVGIFASRREGDEAEEETQAIFLPFTTYQQAFKAGNRVEWFSMTSRNGIPVSVVERKAIDLLAERHQVAPEDRHAFGFWNTEKEFKKINNLFFGINALSWFVGAFSLIAGVIGVSNIMLVIVKERTREIGIRRAIGATPSAVVSQIIMESALLTLVAGYFGLVAGVGAIEFVSAVLRNTGGKTEFFRNPEVNLTIALAALGILMLSGVLAGLIPGYRAIRINPIEAIRSE